MKKTTVLIMAAGMGSRFGGLKQIEPVGPHGEIIMDFSICDAKRAGFDKAVFIIKRELYDDFRTVIGRRIEKLIDVDYAFQTMEDMPEGRVKPWGTAHAILCARDQVREPFVAINADDFYGGDAFYVVNRHLKESDEYGMVGFLLDNTTSENGTVARGVCEIQNGCLTSVTEHLAIPKDHGFSQNTIVSMNMWGFRENIFDYLEEEFTAFKSARGHELKSECLIPNVVDKLIKTGREKVRVLTSRDRWYGVTYKEDLPGVKSAIAALMAEGKYDQLTI